MRQIEVLDSGRRRRLMEVGVRDGQIVMVPPPGGGVVVPPRSVGDLREALSEAFAELYGARP